MLSPFGAGQFSATSAPSNDASATPPRVVYYRTPAIVRFKIQPDLSSLSWMIFDKDDFISMKLEGFLMPERIEPIRTYENGSKIPAAFYRFLDSTSMRGIEILAPQPHRF